MRVYRESIVPIEHFTQFLRLCGLKATPTRIDVLLVLKTSTKPLSIEDIIKRARKGTNKVTVYRTISSLEMAGAVARVAVGHAHAHYELADEASHHHHLICTECGKIEDIEKCSVGAALQKKALANSRQFVKINRHAFEFYGLCKRCAKNNR